NEFHTGNLKNPVPCLSQMAAFMEQCFLSKGALNGNAASSLRKGPSTALCKAEIYWAKVFHQYSGRVPQYLLLIFLQGIYCASIFSERCRQYGYCLQTHSLACSFEIPEDVDRESVTVTKQFISIRFKCIADFLAVLYFVRRIGAVILSSDSFSSSSLISILIADCSLDISPKRGFPHCEYRFSYSFFNSW
ncbi:MAG: hypothetical protein V8Q91_16815, partial [Bilophila wadsworthia]|uniref:hypothetical protein n=1 Tax=Bilophila wadsworthia TaxID=35833 RepID=UPI00300E7F93